MSTAVTPALSPTFVPGLRRLYVVRFAFAIVWAILIAVIGRDFGPAVAVLAVLYPLFDVACAIVDTRVSRSTSTPRGLYLNVVISLLAAIGLGIAATTTTGIPDVLRVWGVWAIAAGLIQLVVAISRRAVGGQWPMILSGGISVFAGTGFILMASGADASLSSVAGYATLGGIFFLVSALSLGRGRKAV